MATKSNRKQTIKPKAKGQKPISFKPGGLHESLGVPKGQPIPAAKKAAALNGDYGPKARAQAQFAKNVLTGPTSKNPGSETVKADLRPKSKSRKGGRNGGTRKAG